MKQIAFPLRADNVAEVVAERDAEIARLLTDLESQRTMVPEPPPDLWRFWYREELPHLGASRMNYLWKRLMPLWFWEA